MQEQQQQQKPMVKPEKVVSVSSADSCL